MGATRDPGDAGNTGKNSATPPVKKGRGKPFEKGNQYVFTSDDERINRSGRPKGTTMKELLRREINRIVVGMDGKENDRGIVRGNLVVNQVVTRAISGDMRAAMLTFQFDQDLLKGGQGEQIPANVPSTEVNVTVNAQANAQVLGAKKEKGIDLVDRLREIYGLAARSSASTDSGTAAAAE